MFRTADIHEVLPPILACVLVWEMALPYVTTGAYDQAPPGVRRLFILGVPVTVTALSWWELSRLRRHHGPDTAHRAAPLTRPATAVHRAVAPASGVTPVQRSHSA
ncbi:hypothetical protein [Streptomyces gardneri]|uniref:hypothetical protein n=1 Tax=Streptomyces gardneri TaxID=66892 RepID=UPI0035D7D529